MKLICLLFMLLNFNISYAEASCPVGVFVVNKNNGIFELGITNKMSKPYYVRYDRLPWVLLGAGMDFIVKIDGEVVKKASGAGWNSLVLKLGENSTLSSEVDLNYLKHFYHDVSNERVSISWVYDVPNSNGLEEKCRRFEGEIKAP